VAAELAVVDWALDIVAFLGRNGSALFDSNQPDRPLPSPGLPSGDRGPTDFSLT
jgi:hypothetical protein